MARQPSEESDRNVVKSVARVFEVLEAFYVDRQPMSAMQVAKRLKYPTSSTIALLKSMAKLGYLSFDRKTRTYFPTMRILIISQYLQGAIVGDGRVMALMEDLHAQTSETIVLAVQNDLDVQYVHTLPGKHAIMLNARPGDFRPLCGSGAGWALLSQHSDSEIARIVKRLNQRSDEPKIDLSELMAIIEEVRVISYARSYGTFIPGSGSIAMVPPTDSGQPIAICVGGPVDRLQSREREIVKIMRDAIKRHFPS
jgi:IclR family KDG regulon transcriptional repressor